MCKPTKVCSLEWQDFVLCLRSVRGAKKATAHQLLQNCLFAANKNGLEIGNQCFACSGRCGAQIFWKGVVLAARALQNSQSNSLDFTTNIPSSESDTNLCTGGFITHGCCRRKELTPFLVLFVPAGRPDAQYHNRRTYCASHGWAHSSCIKYSQNQNVLLRALTRLVISWLKTRLSCQRHEPFNERMRKVCKVNPLEIGNWSWLEQPGSRWCGCAKQGCPSWL